MERQLPLRLLTALAQAQCDQQRPVLLKILYCIDTQSDTSCN